MANPAPAQFSHETMLESLVELRFPARPDRLKLIRGAVRTAARMCGLDERTAQGIVLAVDEACQNVIVHGYRGRDDGEIVLDLCRRSDGLFVRVRDSAPPVDPSRIQARALSDVRPGKLGSYFMKELMDSVEYHRLPEGGNLLEMLKRKDGKR